MTTTQEIRAKLLDETYEQSVDELKDWLLDSSDHQQLVRLVNEVVRAKFIAREED